MKQGLYGTASAKPTDLLCIHGTPDIEAIFERYRTRMVSPATVSIGANEKGQYKTQQLKAYPQAFCKAIAEAAYAHVLARGFFDPSENLPDDVMKAVDALNAPIGDSTLGPDFCRDGLKATTHDWRSARSRA